MKTMGHTLFDSSFTKHLLNGLGKVAIFNGETAANENEHGNSTTRQSIEKAEAELRGLSDGELQDLGITRGEISYVVRHGRSGIDPDPDPAGRCAA